MAVKRTPSLKEREMKRIGEQIATMRGQLEVFEKAGLRKGGQYKELVQKINSAIHDQNVLFEEDCEDKRNCTAHILLCIAAADFACEACCKLHDLLKMVYGKIQQEEYEFIQLLDNLATELAQFVTIIDKVQDDRMSMNFAEMSDEVMDTLTKPALGKAIEIVKRHDKGNNLRTKKRNVNTN